MSLGIKWISEDYNNQETRMKCRDFALEHFDEVKQANKYLELYKKLLGVK